MSWKSTRIQRSIHAVRHPSSRSRRRCPDKRRQLLRERRNVRRHRSNDARASGRAQFSGVRPRLRRGGSNPEQGGRPEDRRGRASRVRRDQWTDDYSRQRQECIGRRNCRTGRKHRHDRQALGCRKRVGRPGGPSCTPAAVYGAQWRLLGRGISVAHHRDRHGGGTRPLRRARRSADATGRGRAIRGCDPVRCLARGTQGMVVCTEAVARHEPADGRRSRGCNWPRRIFRGGDGRVLLLALAFPRKLERRACEECGFSSARPGAADGKSS